MGQFGARSRGIKGGDGRIGNGWVVRMFARMLERHVGPHIGARWLALMVEAAAAAGWQAWTSFSHKLEAQAL